MNAAAAVAATTVTPAAADSAAHLPGLGQTALSLLLVLGLIFLLGWGLKRLQGIRVGGQTPIRVHGGLQLGPKERVLLIEAGGQHLLIGVTAGGISTLHVYAEPPVAPGAGDGVAAAPPFAAAFREALGKSLGKTS